MAFASDLRLELISKKERVTTPYLLSDLRKDNKGDGGPLPNYLPQFAWDIVDLLIFMSREAYTYHSVKVTYGSRSVLPKDDIDEHIHQIQIT